MSSHEKRRSRWTGPRFSTIDRRMANEDLILEILKRVQADAAETRRHMANFDTRLSAHDDHLRGMLTSLGGVQAELSQLNVRVDRIERRLDLTEA